MGLNRAGPLTQPFLSAGLHPGSQATTAVKSIPILATADSRPAGKYCFVSEVGVNLGGEEAGCS